MPDLKIGNLGLSFGGVEALQGVSFAVPSGQLCAVVGPNGAGKTSLFNCISGLYRPSSGSIHLGDQDITRWRGSAIAKLGVARTFQNVAFVESLTLAENIAIAGMDTSPAALCADMIGFGRSRTRRQGLAAKARAALQLVDLEEMADALPTEVPFGTLKRAEIARVLMAEPDVILMDEPAGGLTKSEVAEFAQLVREVHAVNAPTILLVEHHMGFVMSLAEQLVVMDRGRLIAQGVPDVVSRDPVVIDAYLGPVKA